MGSGEVELLPAGRLGGVVDRYSGLYLTRVLGLVQSNDRVYLLGAGNFASRSALRAEGLSAGAADREFVGRQHVFQFAPERMRTASGHICLMENDGARYGLVRSVRGEVMLEAGKAVSLFDPSDPSLTVELSASDGSPMNLREIAALSGRLGIYAGLMRQRGQVNASIAVQGPAGEIAFKSAPDPLQAGAVATAPRGSVALTVRNAGSGKPIVADREEGIVGGSPPPAPEAISVKTDGAAPAASQEPSSALTAPYGALASVVPPAVALPPLASGGSQRPGTGAPQPPVFAELPPAQSSRREVATATVAIEPGAEADKPGELLPTDRSYHDAMRRLLERQGTGAVRSVSELTRVHPAVDRLRALLR